MRSFCFRLAFGTALAAYLHAPASAQTYGPWTPLPNSTTCANFDAQPVACIWDIKLANAEANVQRALQLINKGKVASEAASPRRWFDRSPAERYDWSGPVLMLVHRGLVDLYRGIPENTVYSVMNAVHNHLYMVEVDIQVSKDGEAMALHDLSARRPMGIETRPGDVDKLVNQYNAAEMTIKRSQIKNPKYNPANFSLYQPPFFEPFAGTGSRSTYIRTARQLFNEVTAITETSPVTNTTVSGADVTFVWDPKNLESAQAIGRLVIENPEIAKRSMMKIYADQWSGTTDRNQVDLAVSRFMSIADTPDKLTKLQALKMIPVVNVLNELNGADAKGIVLQNATRFARKYVDSWAKNFEIAAVEFPGAYHPYWESFITDRYVGIGYMLNWQFPKNPQMHGTRYTYSPLIAAGYRFEDFSFNGIAYDWNMDSLPKQDTADPARRTICGQIFDYRKTEFPQNWYFRKQQTAVRRGRQKEIAQGRMAMVITADFPLQESYCLRKNITRFPEWGNPQLRVTTSNPAETPYMSGSGTAQ